MLPGIAHTGHSCQLVYNLEEEPLSREDRMIDVGDREGVLEATLQLRGGSKSYVVGSR